ncbi:hypothetical protein ZIOFF_053815 [Zingiber officinale]|uniref:Replication protein A C-terminal domain-containing protein n=1 Tax=Zingiber officinale TaxID=94328 RepID=A0A8J5FD33_ZINOF|nr:hypothetical protein ZIOFF_053815 [Zingiber officinale]
MFSSQIEGGGFGLSQSSQNPDSGFSKNRGATGLLPLTVKQISAAFDAADDKSSIKVDGADATNIRLLGLVMNKAERATDVHFTLDDGTGRIDVIRWQEVNDASDANETAVIQNGTYVSVSGSLKGFQDKKRAVAFSVRQDLLLSIQNMNIQILFTICKPKISSSSSPVTDYNAVALHFIQCIHVHLWNAKQKGNDVFHNTTSNQISSQTVQKEYQPSVSSQPFVSAGMGGSKTDTYKLVLDIFQEPSSLASDHGLHIDEVARRLGLPMNKIKEAIDYYVDIGHIYSTIDDYHFKSACID